MKPIRVPTLSSERLTALEELYRTPKARLRTRAPLKAMWAPKGRQVMIPTPAQPKKRYGIGAVDYQRRRNGGFGP